MFELSKEYGCNTCVAACCKKGVRMPLSPAEVSFMEAGGTVLEEVVPAVDPGRRRVRLLPLLTVRTPGSEGVYELQNDCGYKGTDPDSGQQICNAYNDPGRPEICGDFDEGGFRCRTMRVEVGVDGPDELELYLQQTAGG
jgi:hypothetical protein